MKDNWIDIIPPIPPDETLPVWLWVCTAALSLLIAIFYFWYQSAEQKSLRAVKALRQQLICDTEIESIPFAISEVIKQRFDVNNIDHIQLQEVTGWQNYKKRLLTSCFSRHKPGHAEIDTLLSEASYWLKQDARA